MCGGSNLPAARISRADCNSACAVDCDLVRDSRFRIFSVILSVMILYPVTRCAASLCCVGSGANCLEPAYSRIWGQRASGFHLNACSISFCCQDLLPFFTFPKINMLRRVPFSLRKSAVVPIHLLALIITAIVAPIITNKQYSSIAVFKMKPLLTLSRE